ncbi:MAG: SHOCT domain-containing protein [Halobacteriota archaeon]|jgi:hypothetical protein
MNKKTAVYTYSGAPKDLLAGVHRAIQKMNLTKKSENINDYTFSIDASEKTKLVSTSWPIHFKIESSFMNGISELNVEASSKLTSITQSHSNKKKTNEFLDLVKGYAPNIPKSVSSNASTGSALDELQKLGALREQGILTEEEFKEQKRKLLGTETADQPRFDTQTGRRL